MKLEIDLVDFLELMTYNQLFNYVDLPHGIAQEINNLGAQEICYIEFPDYEGYEMSNDIIRVWYPLFNWTNEVRRRKEMEALSIDWKKNYKPIIDKTLIQNQIIAAIMNKNMIEVERLTKLLE